MTTPVDALQRTLAAEHAVVYTYGVLGGRTSQAVAPDLLASLRSAYAEHVARRDELVAALRVLVVEPVPAEVGYRVAATLTPARVARAALALEHASAEVYAAQVADTTGEQRAWAVAALAGAAVRGLGFGGLPETMPGAEQPADAS